MRKLIPESPVILATARTAASIKQIDWGSDFVAYKANFMACTGMLSA